MRSLSQFIQTSHQSSIYHTVRRQFILVWNVIRSYREIMLETKASAWSAFLIAFSLLMIGISIQVCIFIFIVRHSNRTFQQALRRQENTAHSATNIGQYGVTVNIESANVTEDRLLTEMEVQQFTKAYSRSLNIPTDTISRSNSIGNGSTSSSPISAAVQNLRFWSTGSNSSSRSCIEACDSYDDIECAVCLGKLMDDAESDTDISLLPCQHKFHTICITPWLTSRQSKCPLCKYDVLKYIHDQQNTATNKSNTLTTPTSTER